jgi:hypothetical protein
MTGVRCQWCGSTPPHHDRCEPVWNNATCTATPCPCPCQQQEALF